MTNTDEYLDELRKLLPIGTTIYTIVRHVSRGGTAYVDPIVIDNNRPLSIGWRLRQAGFSGKWSLEHNGFAYSGFGYSKAFQLVYEIGRFLHSDGHGCIGEHCPSNDHSNGDRNYNPHTDAEPHWHRDGGYAYIQVAL